MTSHSSLIKWSLLCVAIVLLGSGRAHATVGATVPFTTYEGEAGTLAGGATAVSQSGPPTTKYSSPQLEASGRSYAALTATGQSVTWTNGTSQSFGAITIRFCIPDSSTGGGTTGTLDLYVNGTLRQTVTLSSAQTWLYEGATYHANDNNPADGQPWRFWDELPVIVTGAAIAPGSTVTLKKDAANTASFYYIDCVDMEPLPAPIAQPAGSLSIVTYGAVANSPATDSTAAIQSCINAAAAAGKVVWIPQGTFYLTKGYPGLNANSAVTIEGAGVWYSVIYHNPPLPDPNSPNGSDLQGYNGGVVIKNVAFDSNSQSGANADGACGGLTLAGPNWLVDTVWLRHCGVWAAGTGGTFQNSRINNSWGDGININNVTGGIVGNNLTVTNNFIRASGDDSIAINSVNYNVSGTTYTYYTEMQNPTVTNNTVVGPAYASCMGIYGGIADVVENNLLCDGVNNFGLSVGVFGANGSSLDSATVTGNTILRCGSLGSGTPHPGVNIGSNLNSDYAADVYFGSNTITNSYFDGIDITASSNVALQNNTVTSPLLTGIHVESSALGSAIFNSNTVSGLASGQAAFLNDSLNHGVRRAIQAASYNAVSGTITAPSNSDEGGYELQNISNGSYVVYNAVDLRNMTAFAGRVASGSSGGNIEIRLDSATGTLIGTCAVASTGNWHVWGYATCGITPTNGVHNVYLVFTGAGGGLMNLAWFSFSEDVTLTEASAYTAMTGSVTASTNNDEGGTYLGSISSGSTTSYAGTSMTGLTNFYIRVASGGSGGSVAVHIDSPTGTLIGTATVPATGGWHTWATSSCVLTPATGSHTLYLTYTGSMNVAWFQMDASPFQSLTAVQGASYNAASGSIGSQACGEGGLNVDDITNTEYTVYNDVNLAGVKTFTARVSSNATTGGNIQIRLDSATGTLVGTCAVPYTGGWQTWTTKSCALTAASGYHNLYLVYTGVGGGAYLLNLENFQLGY